MMKIIAATAALALGASAASAITLDGQIDAEYGAGKRVELNAAQASYDFQAPTQYSEATGYSIYLAAADGYVYGYVKADAAGQGQFANLYFDIDPNRAVPNGSDIGFEITNDRMFVAGRTNEYNGPLSGLDFVKTSDGLGIEFAIANQYFTQAQPGLSYYGDEEFPTVGSQVTLRLSQSFNYTVAGGASYGNDRLGSVTLAAGATGDVPEPATWAAMVLGFGLVGGAIRRRRPAFAAA